MPPEEDAQLGYPMISSLLVSPMISSLGDVSGLDRSPAAGGRVRPRPSVPSWSTCPALTSMCWPWSTSSLGPLLRIQTEALRIQTEALDSPDFVEIGAKPTRQDGQRGRLNGGGSPWVPCHLARPRPRGTT